MDELRFDFDDPHFDGDADYEPGNKLNLDHLEYDDDENFSDTFSGLGVDDADDPDADFGEPARKKRKHAVTTTSKPRTMDSITNARIKTEGGEAFILDDDSTSLTHKQTSRAPGAFERRLGEKGRTSAAKDHKRVTADLDSDDELILEMREKGFNDREISERLTKEGRTQYDTKSISTRIMRIRLAQADHFDRLLEDGIKEWKLDDDKRLVQAYALADIEISYEIERVRAWRFRKVSEYMRRINSDSMFSAKACRTRYSQLISGTARIPCGVDDDPDARYAELESFRLSREAARDKEADERETQEAMEKRVKDAAKIKSAQKAEETANKRATIEQGKANRALQRAAVAQLRMQKAAEIQKAKVERNAQIKKAASTPKKATSAPKKHATAHAAAGPSNPSTRKSTSAAKIKEDPEPVDPRSYLNTIDLISMCANRGLTPKNTTKKELLATLNDADMEYSHDDLRRMCKAKGITPSGTKTVMRYQLAMKAAQMCASYQAGLSAAGEGEGEDEDDMVVDAE